MRKNYNVAVIGTEGNTSSTQLWNVPADEPLRVVQRWAGDPLKHLTPRCPVVIALHGGEPVFMTVGEVLATSLEEVS
jgi:hypothetical protein